MKIMYAGLASIIAIFFAATLYFKEPEQDRLGSAQIDNKGGHVANKEYGGAEPPTSGDHAESVKWGPYTTELDDAMTLHNLEHGGIYVSYTSSLPENQVEQLRKMLFPPYSIANFKPLKVVLAPREANESPLILSSWNRSLKLQEYNRDKVINYYKTNANKSPEPSAR
jgi:hypothetical protein